MRTVIAVHYYMKTQLKPYFKQLICDTETPVSLFQKLALSNKYAFLLESAETKEKIGQYSFLGFDPIKLFVFKNNSKKNPLKILKNAYKNIKYERNLSLPNLQAGLVGYFSYEIVRHFEKLNLPLKNPQIPEGIFFMPKNLLVFDHYKRTLTLIAYNEKDLKALVCLLKNATQTKISSFRLAGSSQDVVTNGKNEKNFKKMVNDASEKIRSGEIFQIVLSQLFKQQTIAAPFDIYRKLRAISPSPYMYYLQYPDFSIIGSSPETLVRTEKDEIIIRPIAGTRLRGATEEENKKLELELINDSKEQAEHMMLVDLGRNDIGSIAKKGSVKVTQLMKLERFSHVLHLVSEIRGKKRKNKSLFDIFKAAFPAGTLTGAPKIRAMELIADFEKQPRGIYGGAVGYFDLSGNMDFAIAIRTILYKDGMAYLRAGAGIVYDSIAANENKECFNKARAPLTALSS